MVKINTFQGVGAGQIESEVAQIRSGGYASLEIAFGLDCFPRLKSYSGGGGVGPSDHCRGASERLLEGNNLSE